MSERFDEADESVGVDDHVADVVAAVSAVAGPCVIVGHSYGSIPMWGAASVMPDRVVALVDLDGFLPRAMHAHSRCFRRCVVSSTGSSARRRRGSFGRSARQLSVSPTRR